MSLGKEKGVMSLFLSFTDCLGWRAPGMGNDSPVSRLCSRIDDLPNLPELSKYLKAIEMRAQQE